MYKFSVGVLFCLCLASPAFAQQQWTYTYNDFALMETADGPRTDVIDMLSYSYDNNGNLSSVENALGHITTYGDYNGRGQAQSITDVNGVMTELTYHVRGWLLSTRTVNPQSPEQSLSTIYNYDAVGNLFQLTLPDGSFTRYEYDGADRLIAIENALGERIDYTLDAEGNRREETILAADSTITFSVSRAFDELSRLMTLTSASSNSTATNYDVNNNPVVTTNPRQLTINQEFDALNRLIKIIDPKQGETQFSYDDHDRLTTVTDAEGLTTYYSYDAYDNLIRQSSPDTGATVHQYDNANNRILTTDARGVTTQYSYDALNRLISVSFPSKPAENISYTYDDSGNGNSGVGRLTGISDASGTTSYRYNYYGALTEKRTTINDQTFTHQYSYNDQGQLSATTYPSGRTLSYSYNMLGQVTSILIQTDSVAPESSLVSNVQYLPYGPLSQLDIGLSGIQTQLSYDNDYRLVAITTTGLAQIRNQQYSYDPNSNITAILYALSERDQDFDYDELDRLIFATGIYGDISYSYDRIGNRTDKLTDENGTLSVETYTYAPDSHQLKRIDIDGRSRYLGHDAKGNTIFDAQSNQDTDTIYNHANRPEQSETTTRTLSYRHNALGQRVLKQGSESSERYHYNENGQLIAVSDTDGNSLAEYIYLQDRIVATVDRGQLYFTLSDHLNTVTHLVDGQGQVLWQQTRTPFGLMEVDDDPDNDGNAIVFNLRFPGQYYDLETQTNYNYYRTYDPSLGRYTQSDPIGLDGGINTYGYVYQNPIMNTDPTGLICGTGACVGIAVGVGRVAQIGYRGYRAYQVARALQGVTDELNERTNADSRAIPWPPKKQGKYSCICRAEKDGRNPDNCSNNNKDFAFGWGVANDPTTARKIAEKMAKNNLGATTTHHPSCKCTGPTGDPIPRGGR